MERKQRDYVEFQKKLICPVCNGEGKLPRWVFFKRECPLCIGAGMITKMTYLMYMKSIHRERKN